MLGIFDSGLGGFTVLRRLRERLPRHDVIYLADQAHVPYGDRSPDELLGFLAHNLQYLNETGADAIVVACNTSCAIAMNAGWPPSQASILNLIESAGDAVASLGVRRIGVLATTVTARSLAYTAAIRARVPDARVEEVAAPALVPLVEAGRLHGGAVHTAVSEACAPFSDDLEALVYGCTHYPILDAHFAAVLGPRIARIDPALAQAEAAERLVSELKIAPGSGSTRFATTGDALGFVGAVRALLGDTEPNVVSATEILTRIGNL